MKENLNGPHALRPNLALWMELLNILGGAPKDSAVSITLNGLRFECLVVALKDLDHDGLSVRLIPSGKPVEGMLRKGEFIL